MSFRPGLAGGLLAVAGCTLVTIVEIVLGDDGVLHPVLLSVVSEATRVTAEYVGSGTSNRTDEVE